MVQILSQDLLSIRTFDLTDANASMEAKAELALASDGIMGTFRLASAGFLHQVLVPIPGSGSSRIHSC